MVGGGEDAFIGSVHRSAASLDGEIELVCGALSASAEKAQRSGRALHLSKSRIYDDYQQMIIREAELPANERMQFVAIVTPNHLHFPIAKTALEKGFHVLCEKPATLDLEEALRLRELVKTSGLQFGLTYTYSGYPLIKEAMIRVAAGELGKIRKIVVEYPQGWLADRLEPAKNKQAAWRLDPTQAGISGCMGDIGVHAAHLAEYVSGIEITALCADLTTFVEGRNLDDDGSVLLRFSNGAKGVLLASQISAGEENGVRIRVYGDKGGLDWCQLEPNNLWLKSNDHPIQLIRAGGTCLSSLAKANTRIPMGHPEGYLEAFANIYMAFIAKIHSRSGDDYDKLRALDCPGIDEAVRGMRFIELAVAASKSDIKWHEFGTY